MQFIQYLVWPCSLQATIRWHKDVEHSVFDAECLKVWEQGASIITLVNDVHVTPPI